MNGNIQKIILDACCGGKMFWWDKKNPHVLFLDKRSKEKGFMKTRQNFEVNPDIIGDFRQLPFEDSTFKMVVFDPPHTIRPKEEGGVIAERYGRLTTKTWADDLQKGFQECWRVLEPYGTLIFKWAENDKKLKDIIHLFPAEPMFGSRVGARGGTIWLCFMKVPK
jgi:SAM-dependent methyltransferase